MRLTFRGMRAAVAALAAPVAIGVCAVPVARAQIAWRPCGDSNDYACGHLTVPQEPGGSSPETITLALRRHRAPVGEAREAIVALAGGPGQAAIPFAEQFAHLLGPIAATRDLIVFDQRGIGLSHPLSCHRFELADGHSAGREVAECAAQIGPVRGDYTTAQTVADIEAIRQAGGYEKLVLYGTSYGTKVAERYAQAHPGDVAGLVLDSVVPPGGPEPLNLPTFAAIPRVLRGLCGAGACTQITRTPVRDLARLVRRLGGGPLAGRWLDGEGRAHTLRFSASTLLAVLVAGDLEPVLRAEFPAAVRAAAAGDTAPFARVLRDFGQRLEGGEAESPAESFDTPLFFVTSCEEEPFPWSRTASPATRLAEVGALIARVPAGRLAPFERSDVLPFSDVPACAFWPYTAPAPAPVTAPLPDVPALILSGAEDLRTPTSGAREVAARIPDSHLLVVPEVGHSVLSSDLSGCARRALLALFKPAPIASCRRGASVLGLIGLAPLAPSSLGRVAPAPAVAGVRGRTLRAVALTLADLARQAEVLTLGGSQSAEGNLQIGGLRAGWAAATGEGVTLTGYSYVPGVSVSGRIDGGEALLRIGGSAAARGTLRLGAHDTLAGTLSGRRVRATGTLDLAAVASAIVRADAQAVDSSAPGDGSAVRIARARRLARILASGA